MTRLIDADAFENYVFDEWNKNEISNGDWMTFREWLRDQETVDAVPVIRCKDCKQCRKTILFGHLATVCDYWIKLTDDDGYCNHAERKES